MPKHTINEIVYGLNSSLACRREDQLLLGNMTNSIYISLSFSRVREERILPCSSVCQLFSRSFISRQRGLLNMWIVPSAQFGYGCSALQRDNVSSVCCSWLAPSGFGICICTQMLLLSATTRIEQLLISEPCHPCLSSGSQKQMWKFLNLFISCCSLSEWSDK